MSDAIERPEASATDADAWAKACAEDLAAEQARRRAEYGPQPGSAAEEMRRMFDALSDKVAEFRGPAANSAAAAVAQTAAQQFAKGILATAKGVIEPVLDRNPDVFDHLAAAGSEIAAAYRAAVERDEARWTKGDEPKDGPEHIDLD